MSGQTPHKLTSGRFFAAGGRGKIRRLSVVAVSRCALLCLRHSASAGSSEWWAAAKAALAPQKLEEILRDRPAILRTSPPTPIPRGPTLFSFDRLGPPIAEKRSAGSRRAAASGFTDTARRDGAHSAAERCVQETFSFVVFSDTYVGDEAAVARLVGWARRRWPELRFFVSAGDTPPYLRVRAVIDAASARGSAAAPCATPALPWFPAVGNHDAESPSAMMAWARRWADDPATPEDEWQNSPARSPLARQLPGIEQFVRGPRWVWTRDPVSGEQSWRELPAGTVYRFDYRGVRFVFLDTYEQGIYEDSYAGVWDGNGSAWHDPEHSQLDWLEESLVQAPHPRAVFVFGHVALVAPCYNRSPPAPQWPCPGPPPPGWSEHNSRFHTEELLARLSAHGVTAYFHGHDHVPSRLLLAPGGRVLADERFWQAARRFPPPPRVRPEPLAPGTLWQVSAGSVGLAQGSFVHVRVSRERVDLTIYRYRAASERATAGDPLGTAGRFVRWDAWSIALGQGEKAARASAARR
jgi:hypothetical protein